MTNPFSETTSWSYQDNNWLSTQTLANGATATYTYNALGRATRLLNQISGTTISDFSTIGYDGVGNRTSVSASIPGATALSGTTGYTYDSKNQITQETSTRNGGFTDNFGYDSAGNPTTFKGLTKTYNSNNQQTGTGFSHDANGNPTTYGGTTLTFDPENRLTAYGSVLTAAYTGDGLRAWKQNSSGRTYFLYDGIVPVVELDSSGSVSATNTFGAAGLVSRRAIGTSVFYTFDSEGNVSQRTDASGSVLSNHLFAAHGVTLSGTLSEPFGYKAQFGYYTDNETGLQLLTHRYCDLSTGRFLTRDPISYSGGINLYAYVGNSPTSTIDPLGLEILTARQYEQPIMVPPGSDLEALGFASNVCAGFGDGIGAIILTPAGELLFPQLNPVSGLRGLTPGGAAVDPHSGPYWVGRGGAVLWSMALGGAVSAAAGGAVVESELPGLPSSAAPLGLGSTGPSVPANLSEQLAMEQVMSNPGAGTQIRLSQGMTDARWPGSQGWVKMSQNVNGHDIHYVLNRLTGAVDDFKFK